ncbi:energy transducer TonB [Roseateles violae]|uniref:Energy transducer TonB n=1 Tax=Roseateles violae TaxID=3058042 RepID=A0ABT8DLX7_9BURK|nr:energy transducer TonB [Pelomonas sp. PFR6]MDN3918923.1 energy transducer TonB [Pelomonas sp. PFR6]
MTQAALRPDELLSPPTPPAAAAPLRLGAPPAAQSDDLGPNGRRWLTGGVLLAHVVGGWALLQIDSVRQVISGTPPTIIVDMIAPAEPPRPAPPPPPAPQPRKIAPAPASLIAAAPTPTPAPPSFVAPAPEPAPPTPVQAAPAPPAPPAPVAAPAEAQPKKVPPGSVRYLTQPKLNFPLLSKRLHESGMVVLRIVVDVNGRLKDASVLKSSGFERLDQQALQDIRSARFVPQTEDGKPIEIETKAALAYDLDR